MAYSLFFSYGYALGDQGLLDPTDWEEVFRNPGIGVPYSIAYGNGNFMVVGRNDSGNGLVLVSSNGTTWQELAPYDFLGYKLLDVAYGGGVWVAAAEDNSTHSGALFWSTDNGSNWTQWGSSTTDPITDVFYSASARWMATGEDGVLLTSANGTSWQGGSYPSTPNQADVSGITYHNGQWTLVYKNDGAIYTSPNGTHPWTTANQTSNRQFHSVYSDGSRTVAVGRNRAARLPIIFTSANGASWSEVQLSNPPSNLTLFDVIKAGDQWVASSVSQNRFALSSDGVNWVLENSNEDLEAFAYNPSADNLLAVGYGGIYRAEHVSTSDLSITDSHADEPDLDPGESFRIYATVRNQGTMSSATTTLRYFISDDSTITTPDQEVAQESISFISPNADATYSERTTAPSTPGPYYVGACVDSYPAELNPNNNCSQGYLINVLGPSQYLLTVNRVGNGTITSIPAGIDCPSTRCFYDFDADTQVTLSASSFPGNTFVGWSGAGCFSIGACNLTLTGDTTVTATFQQNDASAPTLSFIQPTSDNGTYFTTASSVIVSGSASDDIAVAYVNWKNIKTGVSGQASGTTSWQANVDLVPGNNVIYAQAFDTDGKSSETKSITVVKDGEPSGEYLLSVNVTNQGNSVGAVTSRPGGIACTAAGGDCSRSFAADSVVTLIANSTSGTQLDHWVDCPAPEDNECKVTLSAPATIGAVFTPNRTPTLGIANPKPPEHVDPGEIYTISFAAVDPDGNLDRVEFYPTGDGEPLLPVDISGVIHTFETSYPEIGTYTWKAVAVDTEGRRSKWRQDHVVVGTQATSADGTGNANPSKNEQAQCDACPCFKADPIDTSTGGQVLQIPLLSVHGVISLDFTLDYNSLLVEQGILGRGWSHSYGIGARLVEEEDGDTIRVYWSANRGHLFVSQGNGEYRSEELDCRFDVLVRNADHSFTLTRKDKSVYQFDSEGILRAIEGHAGNSLNLDYDDQGRLALVTEPVSGVYLAYTYNAESLLEGVRDPLGRRVSFTYTEAKDLETITHANGVIDTFTYNAFGQALSRTDSTGVTYFVNTYDDHGRVIAQDDGRSDNLVMEFSYDETSEPGKIITTYTDASGAVTVNTFDRDYRLLRVENPQHQVTVHTYYDNGRRATTTDRNGHTTRFEYDDAGNLVKITDPAGGVTEMYYDAERNLLWRDDALDKRTSNQYNPDNTLASTTDPSGNTWSFTYNADRQIETKTSPRGKVTRYTYELGRVKTLTDPEGMVTTYDYDAAGRKILSSNAASGATRYEYDELDRITAIVDGLGNRTEKRYDSRGNLVWQKDPNSNITTYEYDGDGNLILRTDAVGVFNYKTRFVYDGEDRLIETINPRNNSTHREYYPDGQLKRILDARGNAHSFTYDAADNLLTETDANGDQTADYTYDSRNNRRTNTDAQNRTAQYSYDALSRQDSMRDPAGRLTQLQYDTNDRLIKAIDALDGEAKQGFDADGNRDALEDPNNNRTGFTFDGNDQQTGETAQAGGTIVRAYDAGNRLASITNARGQARSLTYYANGWLKTETSPEGTWTYSYDNNGNLLTLSGPDGTITRRYDALNRVIDYTGVNGNTIGYGYDEVGNLIRLTYPDGKVVRYEYDADNRMTKVTDWADRVTRYGYNNNGRLIRVDRSNGSYLIRTYVKGELIRQEDRTASGALIASFAYSYDQAGNIATEEMTPEPDVFSVNPATMTYGPDNRLATWNGQAVQFDSDGNMVWGPLALIEGAEGDSGGGPPGGIPDTPPGYVPFADSSANTAQSTMQSFEYDSRNRLIRAGSSTYAYDAEDHRLSKTENGITTSYVVNPHAALSQVLVASASGEELVYYVYGLGLIGQEQDGQYLNYHYDLRGSTVALSDISGQITDRFQYAPYGEMVAHSGNADTPFLYNGRDGVMEEGNGLVYMRARFYNVQIHQFVSKDILLFDLLDGQSMNRFSYVQGDPVRFIDPLGLEQEDGSWPLTIAQGVWDLYSDVADLYVGSFDGSIYSRFMNGVSRLFDMGKILNSDNKLLAALSVGFGWVQDHIIEKQLIGRSFVRTKVSAVDLLLMPLEMGLKVKYAEMQRNANASMELVDELCLKQAFNVHTLAGYGYPEREYFKIIAEEQCSDIDPKVIDIYYTKALQTLSSCQ